MECDSGNILNVILAVALFFFALRDIVANAIEKDFSTKEYPLIIRWFLSSKEQVIAKNFLRELGFPSKEKFKQKIEAMGPYDYSGAITFISNCIEKTENGEYEFGRNKKHNSPYYIDSMSSAQNKKNCALLYDIMKHLIDKVDRNYQYVFSIKGGNIPLVVTFSKDDNDVLSVMAKDDNERVNLGHVKDNLINYEGLRDLNDKASNEKKGIAVTCNLTTGGTFLNAIKKYNSELRKLQEAGEVSYNIKKIEKVYILYKVTKDNELDDEYKKAGLVCYRYFDLDDGSKSCLLSIKNGQKKIEDFPCYQCIKWNIRPKNCAAKHCYKSLK